MPLLHWGNTSVSEPWLSWPSPSLAHWVCIHCLLGHPLMIKVWSKPSILHFGKRGSGELIGDLLTLFGDDSGKVTDEEPGATSTGVIDIGGMVSGWVWNVTVGEGYVTISLWRSLLSCRDSAEGGITWLLSFWTGVKSRLFGSSIAMASSVKMSSAVC